MVVLMFSLVCSEWNVNICCRREKRASVILRERHEMMISEREERQTGVFTLPRVSCYHRSTR